MPENASETKHDIADKNSMERREAVRLARQRKSVVAEARRRWIRSPWRFLPLPLLAYVSAGTFLWQINVSMPWLRALSPVIVVSIFTFLAPFIKERWFRYTIGKLQTELKPQNEPPEEVSDRV